MKMIFRTGARFFLVLGMFSLCAFPAVGEDDPVYGPRFEAGAGVERILEQNHPEWAAKTSARGMGTLSVRVFKGLSVQGGMDFGGGGNPKADSLTLGSSVVRNPDAFSNSSWAGIRYEYPLGASPKNLFALYSVYAGAGMCWATYGVSGSEEGVGSHDLADLRGPYAIFGLRWRIDKHDPAQQGSAWLDTYGIDAGAKYVRFGEKTLKYAGVESPSKDFSSTQLFAVVFVKFDIAD